MGLVWTLDSDHDVTLTGQGWTDESLGEEVHGDDQLGRDLIVVEGHGLGLDVGGRGDGGPHHGEPRSPAYCALSSLCRDQSPSMAASLAVLAPLLGPLSCQATHLA